MTSRALVVEEGRTRGALAAVRALRAAGWTVGVGSPGAVGLAASSRAVSARHDVPSPAGGAEAFVDAVRKAVDERRYDVVLAAGDAELLAVAHAAERIGAGLPHPTYDRLLRAVDKLALSRAAAAVGLGTPRTELATADAVAAWQGPAVVKPRWHWRPDRPQQTVRCEAVVARDPQSAAQAADAMRSAGAEPVIQELVDGDLVAYTCVLDDAGEVLGRVQQRATRIWPAVAGVSVRAETVAIDADLERGVLALLRGLGWRGIAETQLLATPGRPPVLLDLNGRIYGSLALAVAAGVNIPALGASVAAGRRPDASPAARIGTRYLWLEGELRAIRSGGAGSAMPALLDTLRWARGAVGAVSHRGDRRPGTYEVRALARRAVARGAR